MDLWWELMSSLELLIVCILGQYIGIKLRLNDSYLKHIKCTFLRLIVLYVDYYILEDVSFMVKTDYYSFEVSFREFDTRVRNRQEIKFS